MLRRFNTITNFEDKIVKIKLLSRIHSDRYSSQEQFEPIHVGINTRLKIASLKTLIFPI